MSDFTRDLNIIIENANVIVGRELEFKLPHLDRIENRKVGEMPGLDVRQHNGLKRNNVHTVREIVAKWNDLRTLSYVGATSVKGIKNAVLSYYYDQLDEEEKKEFWRDAFT